MDADSSAAEDTERTDMIWMTPMHSCPMLIGVGVIVLVGGCSAWCMSRARSEDRPSSGSRG